MVGWYGMGVNNILQGHIRVQGMTCSCGHLATAIYFNLLKVYIHCCTFILVNEWH